MKNSDLLTTAYKILYFYKFNLKRAIMGVFTKIKFRKALYYLMAVAMLTAITFSLSSCSLLEETPPNKHTKSFQHKKPLPKKWIIPKHSSRNIAK